MGYVVEGVEQEGEAGGAEAEPPIAAFLATASAARGEAQFKKCAACHTVTLGGANGIGPHIYGVLGEAHGHLPNFQYSDALKSVQIGRAHVCTPGTNAQLVCRILIGQKYRP